MEIMDIGSEFDVRSKQLEFPSIKQPAAIYREALRTYREKRKLLNSEFITALFNAYGVNGNPDAVKCFHIAWENYRYIGYREVEIRFAEMVGELHA